MAQLPKKWSRRIFAVYMAVTIFGGIILFLFIVLLGLTYWMSAPAPLPDPNLLIHPKATAWLVIRANGLRDLPQDTLRVPDRRRASADRAPHRARQRPDGPARSRSCSPRSRENTARKRASPSAWADFRASSGWCAATSNAASRSRPCPCRCAIASAKPSSPPTSRPNPLSTFSLAECTLLRCANPAAAEALIDRLEKKADLSADRWPRAPAALPPAGSRAGPRPGRRFPSRTFSRRIPPRSGDWQSLTESLATQFPDLARSRDCVLAALSMTGSTRRWR